MSSRLLSVQSVASSPPRIHNPLNVSVIKTIWGIPWMRSKFLKICTLFCCSFCCCGYITDPGGSMSLQWRNNEHDGVSDHQPQGCLLNRLFRHRSEKISRLRVTGLCEGNSPVTSEFPAQRASNVENASISWRHNVIHLSTLQLLHWHLGKWTIALLPVS